MLIYCTCETAALQTALWCAFSCVSPCVCDNRYVHQLYILVNCFLRPLRMAASSKKPPISHDDVSSIFLNRCVSLCKRDLVRLPNTFCPSVLSTISLNVSGFYGQWHVLSSKTFFVTLFSHFSETIMFLHEIFHQGLKARIANWPTLVLGKLVLVNTHIHTICIHSAATQWRQGQVFCGSPHPICVIQTSVLMIYCPIHTNTRTNGHFLILASNTLAHCVDRQWPPRSEGIPWLHPTKQSPPEQISIT